MNIISNNGVRKIFDLIRNKIYRIGEINFSNNETGFDVPSGLTITPTPICSFWLENGCYLIESTLKLDTGSVVTNVESHIGTPDNQNNIGSLISYQKGIIWLKNYGILEITGASKQVLLKARQDSGSTLKVKGWIKSMKIK